MLKLEDAQKVKIGEKVYIVNYSNKDGIILPKLETAEVVYESHFFDCESHNHSFSPISLQFAMPLKVNGNISLFPRNCIFLNIESAIKKMTIYLQNEKEIEEQMLFTLKKSVNIRKQRIAVIETKLKSIAKNIENGNGGDHSVRAKKKK